MSHQPPLVTIGMPARNSASTLEACLNSLLLQTHTDWELLLMDDGSSDETVEIARSYNDCRIKVLSGELRQGVQVRLNRAVHEARGQYFARMDADDIAYPERLACQLEYLEEHPEVTLVGSWVMVFGKNGVALGKRAGPVNHDQITSSPYRGFPIAHPTFLGRIEYFRKHPYPIGAVRTEDQILLLRTYRQARFANVPEILLGYREESLSLRKILLGRYWFARNASRELRRRGRPVRGRMVLAEQAIKGLVDVLAVTSGLNYKLLRHRARPASEAELQTWSEVWDRVNNYKSG